MKNALASLLGNRGSAAGNAGRSGAFRGSGALSRRRRPLSSLGLIALLSLLLAAIAAPAASAAVKTVDRFIGQAGGGSGGLGGQFNAPRDVAVVETAIGGASAGDTYIADTVNNRIEVLSAAGVFKFAFGRDVIAAGKSGNLGEVFEKCTVAENCQAGSAGTLGGEFNAPQGIAINQSTGDVFVRDRGNLRIQQFSATGSFIRAWGWDVVQTGGTGDDNAAPINEFEICSVASQCQEGSTGAGAGQFATNTTNGTGIAVAPAGSSDAGNVFVVDPGNKRLEEFNPALAPANLFVRSFGSSGTGTGQFANNMPQHVAVDSAGIVYASDTNGNGRVNRYTATAANMNPIAVPPLLSGGTNAESTSGLEIDPDADGAGLEVDTLYVLRNPNSGSCPGAGCTVIQEFDESGATTVGSVSAEHAPTEFGTSNVNGLGINAASGKLYVTVSTGSACGGNCNGVFVLDNDGTSATATATLQAATGIGSNEATLNGTLATPEGLMDYRFEYSKDGINWTALPYKTASVASSQSVSSLASGLEANTSYRVRLVATKVLGTTAATAATTSESFFLTDAAAPTATTLSVAARSDTGALLVAAINPNGSPTTYYFQWGVNTSYGHQIPASGGNAGSGGSLKYFTSELAGLQPSTTYHYRVIAESSNGSVVGSDMSFATRTAGAGVAPGRGYEMLTPPLKSTVSTGINGSEHHSIVPGLASPSGNQYLWSQAIFPTNDEAEFPFSGDYLKFDRTPEGWDRHSQLTAQPAPGTVVKQLKGAYVRGASANLAVQLWETQLPLFAGESSPAFYLRRDGTGTNGFSPAPETGAQFTDDGSSAVFWGNRSGLLGSTVAEDPSRAQTAGNAIYRQADPPAGALDLVNECTGSSGAGDATQIPARVGTGVSTDTIGTQNCEDGAVTNLKGATVGGGQVRGESTSLLTGTAATAMSDDGRRVFFQSPDDRSGPASCTTATGAATSCPAQLFVRQYRPDGEPIVRWISRSRSHSLGGNAYDGAMIAGQQVGLMGRGVAFEGASRDGSVVYFRTNAPLTPDDPNGGSSITTGTASSNSWDLYRYQLPTNLDDDPGAGALTRISGGPTGTADPNTNCSAVAVSGIDIGNCSGSSNSNDPNGAGLVARYISDDGRRVYFVTAAQIPGAVNTPPSGGTMTPTAANAQLNTTTRNLYLYDADKSGAAAYKFITRVPRDSSASAACGGNLNLQGGQMLFTNENCVHGTASGDAIVFVTTARLSADDTDNAVDVYLYDARADALTRVSAPPAGAPPSACVEFPSVSLYCNGDLGFKGSETYAAFGWGGARSFNISQDASGAVSVFFESRLGLVPEDTNTGLGSGNFWDVYQWREGGLSLISPGDTADDAYYAGNSRDGRDVFFQTSEPLDPHEAAAADPDIYDARIGGGFPYTPPAQPCDALAFKCEANASVPPASTSAASSGFSGPGNVSGSGKSGGGKKCAKGKVRRHGKCVKPKSKHRKAHHRKAHRRVAGANQGRNK